MSNQPRIGITSGLTGRHWAEDGSSWRNYAASIERAGGVPVHISTWTRGREQSVLADLQGLVFSGGNDVDLALYPNPPDLHGEEPAAVMARFHMTPEPERDSYELPLLREALDRDLPILGICRGCQVLNVALGGRLILDIPSEWQSDLIHRSCPDTGHSGRHEMRILGETRLAEALDPGLHAECNSRHHQAVRLDESFTARVAALSPDGIVEAIDVPGRRWAVGVQWHPEYPHDAEIEAAHRPLFAAFVRAAA